MVARWDRSLKRASSHSLPVLRKDDVHADRGCIKRVHARRMNDVGTWPGETVACPPQLVGQEPPRVAKEMGAGKIRDHSYLDPIGINIVEAHRVETDREPVPPSLDLLGQTPLCPSSAMKLRSHDPNSQISHDSSAPVAALPQRRRQAVGRPKMTPESSQK